MEADSRIDVSPATQESVGDEKVVSPCSLDDSAIGSAESSDELDTDRRVEKEEQREKEQAGEEEEESSSDSGEDSEVECRPEEGEEEEALRASSPPASPSPPPRPSRALSVSSGGSGRPRGSRSSSVASSTTTTSSRRFADIPRRHGCPHCSKMFTYPSKLREHIRARHSKVHQCSKCDERFDTDNEWRKHFKEVHSDERVFQCEMCDYQHKYASMVRRHAALHQKSCVCPVEGCDALLFYRQIRGHLRERHADLVQPVKRKRRRTECEGEERVEKELQEEKEQSIRVPPGRVKCPICPRLVVLRDMDAHIVAKHAKETSERREANSQSEESDGGGAMTDGEEKEKREQLNGVAEPTPATGTVIGAHSFPCATCGKEFATRRLAAKHVAGVHEKRYKKAVREKKYGCVEKGCGRTFSTPGALDDHKNAHAGVFPYACHMCDKKYAARSLFAVHLKRYHLVSIKDVDNVQPSSQPSRSHAEKRAEKEAREFERREEEEEGGEEREQGRHTLLIRKRSRQEMEGAEGEVAQEGDVSLGCVPAVSSSARIEFGPAKKPRVRREKEAPLVDRHPNLLEKLHGGTEQGGETLPMVREKEQANQREQVVEQQREEEEVQGYDEDGFPEFPCFSQAREFSFSEL